ncbi:MAG: hypothetical protein JZU55_04365, partial [Afipia sp.]|nr:hypothetical protein [Afipia sp.]
EIIQKLPTVHSPAKLEELALLGIAMTLRRAASKDLRDELSRQVRDIVASVKSGECPDALRNAAHDCVKVLEMARDRRLPRSGPVTGNSFSGMPASHPSSHVQSKQAARGNHLTAFVAAVADAVMGASPRR